MSPDVGTGSVNTTPIYLGAGMMLVGAVLHLVGRAFHGTANDEAATAFETYDAGLREHLNLCAREGGVADCR